MPGRPRVTVLLPVYNAGRFLAGALQSVLDQRVDDMEVVVIDDGSSDEGPRVIEAFAAKDARVRAYSQANCGLVQTLNRGLELARAPFVARMDADDVCLPGRLGAQLDAFAGRPEVAVIGGFTRIVDERGRFLRTGRYPLGGRPMEEFIERGSPVAHPAVTMRREAVLAAGGYREPFRHAEDYDLWLRLHDMGFRIENLPIEVIEYRYHSNSISLRFKREQALATLAARYVHQMRRSGMADPVGPDTTIDEDFLRDVGALISRDPTVELLESFYSDLSLSDSRTISEALRRAKASPRSTRNRSALARLSLRAAHGLWRQRSISAALWQLTRATALSPRAVARMLLGRLRRRDA